MKLKLKLTIYFKQICQLIFDIAVVVYVLHIARAFFQLAINSFVSGVGLLGVIIWSFLIVSLFPLYTFQVVGESGLFTPDDVAYVQNAGVSAVSSPWFLVNLDSAPHDLRNLFGNIS